MTNGIRVMVVDSSTLVRSRLTSLVAREPDIQVVGTAYQGTQALTWVQELRPDVILLTLESVGTSGLEVLDQIMHDEPTPVVAICGPSREVAMMALKAVHMGAVDFIQWDSEDQTMMRVLQWELTEKIRTASRVRVIRSLRSRRAQATEAPSAVALAKSAQTDSVLNVSAHVLPETVVVIGASTGGPTALRMILGALPKHFPAAIVIVQHMPEGFTAVLAAQLERYAAMTVREARNGELLESGVALVAPGDSHLVVRPDSRIQLTKDVAVGGHRPSIDVTMQSVVQTYGARAQGVILTGMGCDGAKGLQAIHESGGKTFAQDANSCVVDGMPKQVRDMGIVDFIDTPVLIARHLITAQL